MDDIDLKTERIGIHNCKQREIGINMHHIISPQGRFSFDQTGKFSCLEIKVLTALNKSLNISCFLNEFLYLKSEKKH